MIIVHTINLPDEEVDSVKSDVMYVGDDNVYKDDDTVDRI